MPAKHCDLTVLNHYKYNIREVLSHALINITFYNVYIYDYYLIYTVISRRSVAYNNTF